MLPLITREVHKHLTAKLNEATDNAKAARGAVLDYRADIDALRALAILLVMAFHFGIPPITGGYIGVDVFFVISGFLITSLLSQEHGLLAGLPNFYARRAKRLMPAFLVVLAVTTVVAGLLLLPEDFTNYLNSAHAALTFRSNTFFREAISDYFAADAHDLPLLHTWSLSIEWQFYLIFPIAYLLARKYLPPRALSITLYILTIALIAYSISLSHDQHGYFLTAARFFELLIGALVARLDIKARPALRRWFVAGGLLGITALSILFTPATPFPGYNALFVCLLTALIILFGKNDPVLSTPWLAHLGKISYSAYLWHWPLIAFITYLQIEVGIGSRLFLLALVLLLADLTFRHVERPGKKLKLRFVTTVVILCVVPILLARGAYLLAWKNDGFPQRLGAESARIHAILSSYANINSHNCAKDKSKGLLAACEFGDKEDGDIVYVIGDSHAKNHRWLVDVLTRDTGLRVILRSYGGCLMLPGIPHAYGKPGDAQRCGDAVADEYARIAAIRPKYVVLIHRWNVYYPQEEISKLSLAVDKIVASGAVPVVVGQSAEAGINMHLCFNQHIKLRQEKENECVIRQSDQAARTHIDFVEKIIADIRARYPSLIYIDLQAVQCADGKCIADIDNVPIYDDDNHLNGFGSARLAEAYRLRFGTPFLAQRNGQKLP